jgi:hypothetical protein
MAVKGSKHIFTYISNGSLLQGSVDVLRSLMILPPAELLLRPLHCMMAFQLDGALIPVQEPVQLRPQPGSGARWFQVVGVKGFAHLIIENAVNGCSRWWPKTGNQQAGGNPCFVPGLLVVSLSSAPQQPLPGPPSFPVLAPAATATCTPQAMNYNTQGQPGVAEPSTNSQPGSKGPSVPVTAVTAPVTAPSPHVQQVTHPTHAAVTAPQDPGGPASRLHAAIHNVTPTWDAAGNTLHLGLPASLVGSCAGVRLEVGGVLLPAGCTQPVKLVPDTGTPDVWEVALPRNLRPFVAGSTLLPCKTLSSADSFEEGHSRRLWELVIRVRWPTAQLGKKVCCTHVVQMLAHHFKRQLHLFVPALHT